MTYTKEALESLTNSKLIEIILELQSSTKLRPEANELTSDELHYWLWSKRRGNFVIATKRDIMEHFNCSSGDYTRCMRQLYTEEKLSENRNFGKRVQSSHGIKEPVSDTNKDKDDHHE